MKSVSFTGHRILDKTPELTALIENTVRSLISFGYTDFYTGGALGFDTMCSLAVLKQKKIYPSIKLHLILPCPVKEMTKKWNFQDRDLLKSILRHADSIEHTSKHYYEGCMKLRNEQLVKYADFLVCYYDGKKSASGTGQTVRMAQKKNIIISNLAKIMAERTVVSGK